MKTSDWDRMMSRHDTDIQFLMGQREAARCLLHAATKHIDAHQRQQLVDMVRKVYEDQRAKPESSFYFDIMGPGFLDFCRLFLENREWDDANLEIMPEDFS